MSESSITKKAYAAALKELMQEMPYEKITVGQICERYGMSRKSFYYHFKDKYDLVAWIFDEDFVSLVRGKTLTSWEFLDTLCAYFYANKDFYQKVLKIQGQNCFSQHFEEFISPIIKKRMQFIFGEDEDIEPICIDFIADGLVSIIKRWLLGKEDISSEKFMLILKTMAAKVTDIYSIEKDSGS